jgi:hypothetical protein
MISVFLSSGISILIVEKGKEWPIRPWRIRAQIILRKIYWKLPRMLYCTTCTSFWAGIISDSVLFVVSGGAYFFWPFSGIITAGIMWTLIEYLNAIDKDQNTNVFIEGKGEQNEI